MLLLLLSFYVHYDLLNCEEIVPAKINEPLLVDHHRQSLVRLNVLLEDLEKKTRELSVLLADENQNDTRREETNALRSVISGKDQNNQDPTKPAEFLASLQYYPFASAHAPPSVLSPDPIGLVPLKNLDATSGPRFPEHFLPLTYPGLDINRSFLSAKSPGLYTTSFFYSQDTTRPEPEIQQVSSRPLSAIPSPVTSLSSTIKITTLGPHAKMWFQQIAPYTPDRNKFRKVSRDQSLSYQEGTTVPTPPRMTAPTSYGSSTQQFNTDDHGFIQVTPEKTVERPAQTPEDPYKTWMTTTAGDVLHGKIKLQSPSTLVPNQQYLDLMKQLHEGYLVVFGTEMFRLIAVKDKREVLEVLAPMKAVYNTTLESGRYVGLDIPFLTILGNLVKMTSEDYIDALRTYSSMLFHTLLKRQQVLSPEVNSMIDQAGLSYNDEEGKRLLCSLKQFEDYPNTNKSSYSICESLIQSILQPFRRPAHSNSRQELLRSISKALRQNIPALLSDRNVGTLTGIGRTVQRVGPQPRKRKKKHNRKKKRKRKTRHFEPQLYNYDMMHTSQDLQPGFMEPITTQRYRTPLDHDTRSKETKNIVLRKLGRHRKRTIFKQRKKVPHAHVVSRIGA